MLTSLCFDDAFVCRLVMTVHLFRLPFLFLVVRNSYLGFLWRSLLLDPGGCSCGSLSRDDDEDENDGKDCLFPLVAHLLDSSPYFLPPRNPVVVVDSICYYTLYFLFLHNLRHIPLPLIPSPSPGSKSL